MGRKYFEIDGYWKDDQSEFEGYIVTNYDDHEAEGEFSEYQVFLYGLSESNIQEAIQMGEDTIEDFVITKYEVI